MIKNYWKIILVMLAGLILQVIFNEYLPVFNVGPQILMITVIYFAFIYGSTFSEIYGFICGLLIDTFSISLFGINSLALTIIGYGFGWVSHKIDESQGLVQLLFTLIASCFYILVIYLAFLFSGSGKEITLPVLFVVPVYNMFLTPVIFIILSRIMNKTMHKHLH